MTHVVDWTASVARAASSAVPPFNERPPGVPHFSFPTFLGFSRTPITRANPGITGDLQNPAEGNWVYAAWYMAPVVIPSLPAPQGASDNGFVVSAKAQPPYAPGIPTAGIGSVATVHADIANFAASQTINTAGSPPTPPPLATRPGTPLLDTDGNVEGYSQTLQPGSPMSGQEWLVWFAVYFSIPGPNLNGDGVYSAGITAFDFSSAPEIEITHSYEYTLPPPPPSGLALPVPGSIFSGAPAAGIV